MIIFDPQESLQFIRSFNSVVVLLNVAARHLKSLVVQEKRADHFWPGHLDRGNSRIEQEI